MKFRTVPFTVAGGKDLSLDITTPSFDAQIDKVALVHFHGGFLVVGEKQSFPPAWLINACSRRGWTYVSPTYRLLPEATGQDVVNDAVAAIEWVAKNLTWRIVVAGSSAGGFLALAATTQLEMIRPMAVLSVYGMNDLAGPEYTSPGTTFMGAPPLNGLGQVVDELQAARQNNAIDEYKFPEDPADKRMQWIAALHEAAIYPDIIAGSDGLASKIYHQGIASIPSEYQKFFPLGFSLTKDFPPTAFLHGDQDSCISVEQSKRAFCKIRENGIEALLEIVAGKDHGFDVMEVASETDIEECADSFVVTQLRSILSFIDQAVKNHN